MIKKILFLTIIFASLLILKSNSVFAYTIADGFIVSECLSPSAYLNPVSGCSNLNCIDCCKYCASLKAPSGYGNARCPVDWGWSASICYQANNCTTGDGWTLNNCGANCCQRYPDSCRQISDPVLGYLIRGGGYIYKSFKCFCKYCGDGECDQGEGEDVWNCCTDCGVPANGCDDELTAHWYTCENNTPVKYTKKCPGWEVSSCGCQGYEKKYYQKGEFCRVSPWLLPCQSYTSCECVKGKCGAECGRNSDCNDGNPNTIDKCESNCTCSHRAFAPTPTPTPKLKLSPTPTPAGPTPTPPSFNFKAELYGDYNSSSEYATVSIEGDSFGHACQPPWPNCRQCSGWDTGLTTTIATTNYCTDNALEVTFTDSSSVNCCCHANHRACIYVNGSWHCCEEECSGTGCTNTVIFNCLDWSCGPPPTPGTTSPTPTPASPSPTPTPLRGPVCTF